MIGSTLTVVSSRTLALSCVFALLFSSCNRSHKRVIAVIPKGQAHLFWQSVHAGAAKAAQENGVEIVWKGPAVETDYTGQLQIAEAMINRRVDAIVMAPIDRKAMVAVVERAAARNIPFVVFDSGVDTSKFVSQVATDNYKAGEMAAERMGQILGGKGKVFIVATQPGAASTEAREKGFQDALAKQFPEIQIVDKRFGMSDVAQSMTVAENMLSAHADVNGIFASNESSAMGAARALQSRPGRIKLVGFDWSPTLIDGLNSGLIDSLVIQDPFRMGYDSMLAAIHQLNGQPVDKIHDLPPRLIERSNLNDPQVQAQLHPDLKKYLQ